MTRRTTGLALLTLLHSPLALAAQWPPGLTLDDGTRIALTGNAQYDVNRFDGNVAGLRDAHGMRRAEFGFSAKRKDYFDAGVQYEFESRTWLDVFVRLHSKGIVGRDVGSVRAGWFKTPVGLDGLVASRAPVFVEAALPAQALYAGRRTGIEWGLNRPRYQLSAVYFGGNDPEGTEQGTTWGGRAAWTPRKADSDVLHLGMAYSSEDPAGDTVRFRARPEAGLTDVRLVDTRTITNVRGIERAGLELIRVDGPLTVQAEALAARAHRYTGREDMRVNGASVWVGWTLTGESRPYNGTLGNIEPQAALGALELVARYSTLDLDDSVRGGTQDNVTLGANYFWDKHVKLQLNYVRSQARRAGTRTDPDAVLLRAQFHF